MADRSVALSLQNLGFVYPTGQQVLSEVNLEIQDSERLGLIGPNGAGKTTLFLLACGILQPSDGSISLYGEPVVPGKFYQKIGMVFQDPDDQLFSTRVWDDIAFGPQNLGLTNEEIEERVDRSLQLTGIPHLADRAPHRLSGGEKRMAAIAAALSMEPGLLIYDEPGANLDARARRRLIDFLKNPPHSVLLASHDLELVLEICQRVAVIDNGTIIKTGACTDVMSDIDFMEAHNLEVPPSLRYR